MALVIDNILETHDGAEPRVMKAEIRKVLYRVIQPDIEDTGEAVTAIAERAAVSTRTVYRVLSTATTDKETGKPISDSLTLDIADRLCRACGTHLALAGARLKWPTGEVTPYVTLRGLTLRPVKSV